MTGLERSVKEKENTPAAAIAGELVRHVTDREPVPGIVYEYELHRRFLPEITLAEVNALAKNWVPDRNRVITVSAPEKTGFTVPDETKLSSVMASMAGEEHHGVRRHGGRGAAARDRCPRPARSRKPRRRRPTASPSGSCRNGVKVVLKPTDFREDEIVFRATSFGGSSLASDADYVPASSASAAVGAGGIGRLSAIDLRKKMTGKAATATRVHHRIRGGPDRLVVQEGRRDDVSVDPPAIHAAARPIRRRSARFKAR